MCQMWLLDYVVQMFTLLTPWIISMPQSQMPLRLLSWLLYHIQQLHGKVSNGSNWTTLSADYIIMIK